MRKYRFFYHYNKLKKRMTVHFRGQCILADKQLICNVVAEEKRNKRQPFVVMQGFASEVFNENGIVVIV